MDARRSSVLFYSASLTLLTLLAGLFGSLFHAEIRSAWPFAWGFLLPDGPAIRLVWPAVAFWSLALAAALLFGYGQYLEQGIRAAQQDLLLERTRELRSLPPKHFLLDFQDVSALQQRIYRDTLTGLERGSREQVLKDIRSILDGLLTLIQSYETRGVKNARWAINVMRFVPLGERRAEVVEIHRPLVPFPHLDLDAEKLDGLLVLRPEFSASLQVREGYDQGIHFPDERLKRIALPVPRAHEVEDGRKTMLPGAPQAYCSGDTAGFSDTSTMAVWCEKNGVFTDLVVRDIRRHFSPANMPLVRSLVSLAIPPLSAGERSPGVVNVHRDVVGMLASEAEAGSVLYPVLTPILVILRDLIELHDAHEQRT